jgi:hypothetical protein
MVAACHVANMAACMFLQDVITHAVERCLQGDFYLCMLTIPCCSHAAPPQSRNAALHPNAVESVGRLMIGLWTGTVWISGGPRALLLTRAKLRSCRDRLVLRIPQALIDLLQDGGRYNFTLSVSNFLAVNASRTITLTKMAAGSTPAVGIVGDSSRRFTIPGGGCIIHSLACVASTYTLLCHRCYDSIIYSRGGRVCVVQDCYDSIIHCRDGRLCVMQLQPATGQWMWSVDCKLQGVQMCCCPGYGFWGALEELKEVWPCWRVVHWLRWTPSSGLVSAQQVCLPGPWPEGGR